MGEKDIWILAADILAEHGSFSVDYIFKQMIHPSTDPDEADNWGRVADAIDQISKSKFRAHH